MRYLAFVLAVYTLAAQPPAVSRTEVYTYDPGGRRVLSSQEIAAPGSAEQRIRNLNGRIAPIEKVEEKVLRDDSAARVLERVIRPFDAAGNPLPPEKIRITEEKLPGGAKSIATEIFRGDLNGGFSLGERRQSLERAGGGRTTVETQVARPTINGSLDTVEKLNTTIVTAGSRTTEDSLTYRRDPNGSFYPAVRKVTETETSNGGAVENTATYLAGEQRRLELAAQTVAETTKRPDGSAVRRVDIFGAAAPGRPAGDRPVLREQRIVETNRTPSGAVETLSIRRPALDGSGTLGPVQKISEKVCTGPCK